MVVKDSFTDSKEGHEADELHPVEQGHNTTVFSSREE